MKHMATVSRKPAKALNLPCGPLKDFFRKCQ